MAEQQTRPFTQFLQEQRRGGLHADLSDALNRVVAAVIETGRQGTLAVNLKIKPTGDGMVQVFDALKLGVPEPEKAASLFYVDEHGNVQRKDPRQTEMPLREAKGAEAV